ncbi:MAG: DUF2141 domain-containing protein [Pseudomonadota bacterium]
MSKARVRIGASAALILFFGAAGSAANAGDMTITVLGVSSGKGMIRAALHAAAKDFPDAQNAIATLSAPARPGATTLVFKGLPPGRYAVAAFHDEDGNGKLKTNLIGVPTEAYGFSRNARGSVGPPSFNAAAVNMGASSIGVQFNLKK